MDAAGIAGSAGMAATADGSGAARGAGGETTGALLREAGDPATPQRRLVQLARARQRDVRAGVVANPNAPRAVLASAGLAHPEALASNPLLGWLAVEDPDHLRGLPARVRRRLLAVADESLLWWAVLHGDTDDQRAALANGSLPAGAAARLREHGPPAVAALAAEHTTSVHDLGPAAPLPGPDRREHLPDADADVLGLLASLDAVPAWLVPVAAASTEPRLRAWAAGREHCPAPWLAELLLDDDAAVREAAHANTAALAAGDLAARATIASAVFGPTATHGAVTAGVAVPAHAGVLTWLRASESGRRWLAGHPDLPDGVAASMAEATAWREREVTAALGRRLPSRVALALAADDDADVRAALARNPYCPPLALAVLAADDDTKVANAVAERAERADQAPSPPPGGPRPGGPRPGGPALDGRTLDQLAARGGRAALVAARAPNATVEQLDHWSHSDDWRVRQACASHRNTSTEVLRRLGSDHDYDVRAAVAANGALGDRDADAMADDEHHLVRGSVARRTVDGALQRRLLATGDATALAGLAYNPRLNGALVPDLVGAAGAHPSGEPALALARRAGLAGEHLVTLAGRDDSDLAAALARRADLPDEAWLRLLDGRHELVGPVRRAVHHACEPPDAAAGSGSGPAADEPLVSGAGELLAEAVKAKRWLVELIRSSQGALPAAVHATLATDGDWRIREQVALDPRCTPAVLERLASDSDFDVRKAVAAHPATPDGDVLAFAADTSAPVRLALLRRPDLPDVVLDRLCDDEDDDVRAAAHTHPMCPAERRAEEAAVRTGQPVGPAAVRSAAGASPAARISAALHPDCPHDVVEELAADGNWRVRMAIAERGGAPGAVLTVLSRDSDRDVRRAVAANPATPPAVIARLAADGDIGVRLRVGAHPSATEDIRRSLRSAALVAAVRSSSVAVRAAAAACPDLPRYLRRRRHLWQSIDWLVRYGVAANPATEHDLLAVLARDGHRSVRALASTRLAPDAP